MTETYTNRTISVKTIKRYLPMDDGRTEVTFADGWSCIMPKEVADLVGEGDEVTQETANLSIITGWMVDGEWIVHTSDQEREVERQGYLDQRAIEKREHLEKHRDEYQAEQDTLPGWIKARIEYFIERGGESFLLDGWGYELAIAHLAVAYHASNLEFDEDVRAVDNEYGCSGNQHDLAKTLVRIHREGKPLSGTIGGLSPITGDPFYEGKK